MSQNTAAMQSCFLCGSSITSRLDFYSIRVKMFSIHSVFVHVRSIFQSCSGYLVASREIQYNVIRGLPIVSYFLMTLYEEAILQGVSRDVTDNEEGPC